MPSNFEDVGEFHAKFGLPYVANEGGAHPYNVDNDTMVFRIKFMEEELGEFVQAWGECDDAGMFDALLDLAYVVFGTAHFLGYPWQEGWEHVQQANMAKLRGAADGSDSKRGSAWDVVKPDDWTPPDIADVLRDKGWDV